MNEKKLISVDPQVLMNIHNALMNTHPTGQDIIQIAAACMDIRRLLDEGAEEAKKEGEKTDGEQS